MSTGTVPAISAQIAEFTCAFGYDAGLARLREFARAVNTR